MRVASGARIAPTLWLIALVAGIAAGGLAVIGASVQRGRGFQRYSTHRAEPDGALGFHEWLRSLPGFTVRRETEELVLLPRDGGLLVVIGIWNEDELPKPKTTAPGTPPPSPFEEETLTKAELKAIVDWVRGGGRLLILESHKNPLYEAFGIDVSGNAELSGAGPVASTPAPPVALSPYVARGAALETRGNTSLALPRDFVPLHRTTDGRVVTACGPFGKGEVIAVSDPWVATNEAIDRAGNGDFLFAVASGGSARVVRFDERHHGFAAERNVMGFARRYGLDAAVFQALLAFAFLAWASRAPSSRPRVPPSREGVESREFVSAMANIYSRMGLRSHAVETYYRRAERALVAALRARGVQTNPLPDDESIRSELRAMGVRNWSGWENVRSGYLDLVGALATGAPIRAQASDVAAAAVEVAGQEPSVAARAPGRGTIRSWFGREERWIVGYARFAARFEREVREAAGIKLDEVVG
jgi:hypothetical protein